MTAPPCERLSLDVLTDYVAGDLPEGEAAALEEHLFACADCGARAAGLEAILRAVRPAVASAEVGGFMTEDVLNRLARDGVRIRSFTLLPDAVVPCAVWDDDEVMVMRMRGEFGDATAVTLSRRVGGAEVSRVTAEIAGGAYGEVLYAEAAAWVRQLPEARVEVVLTTDDGPAERLIGRYTLMHGGSLHR